MFYAPYPRSPERTYPFPSNTPRPNQTKNKVLTKACWADAGLDSNPATQLHPLTSGGRLERKYDGGADPNQGGRC